MLRVLSVAALVLFPQLAFAADVDIVGTYRLISANRLILETGKQKTHGGRTLLDTSPTVPMAA
jgi:hypothetical protein